MYVSACPPLTAILTGFLTLEQGHTLCWSPFNSPIQRKKQTAACFFIFNLHQRTYFFIYFRKRGKINIDVRVKHRSVSPPQCHGQRLNPKPRYVLWPRIKPETLLCMAGCSNQLSHTSQGLLCLWFYPGFSGTPISSLPLAVELGNQNTLVSLLLLKCVPLSHPVSTRGGGGCILSLFPGVKDFSNIIYGFFLPMANHKLKVT